MKRIWPTKARDCVVCTEILQVADDEWVVNNISIEHPLTHIVESEYVRMPTVNVNMCIKEELINKFYNKDLVNQEEDRVNENKDLETKVDNADKN